MSFEEGVIRELIFLRNRLRNLSSAQFNRQSNTYHKHLKDILIHYVKKHYSVVINNIIGKNKVKIMMKNYPQNRNEILDLHMMFNKLEELKKLSFKKDKLELLYYIMTSFLDKKLKKPVN